VREALRETIPRGDLQQELDVLPVFYLCAVDPRFEHQTLRLDQQVAFSPFDLLASIVSSLLSSHPGRFDRLTVDDGCAGLRGFS